MRKKKELQYISYMKGIMFKISRLMNTFHLLNGQELQERIYHLITASNSLSRCTMHAGKKMRGMRRMVISLTCRPYGKIRAYFNIVPPQAKRGAMHNVMNINLLST